jgi:hypothetical protein
MPEYFTIKTANEILPSVIEKFKNLKKEKNEVLKLEHKLQSSVSTTNQLEQYVSLKQELNRAITQFYDAITELEDTGAMIKDIDQGLLDFPSKRFDEEIWLCWKEGETEIRFWHEIDSGFNGRKPVTVSDESLV